MARGDHLRSPRGGYSHHGIGLGDGLVAHYSGDERKDVASAKIRISSMAEFADGQPVFAVEYALSHPADTVASRALSREGEQRYNLVFSNCEHFARWCKVGESRSSQIDNATAAVTTPVAAKLGLMVVSGALAGAPSLAGAARTTSLLANAGALVGGGAQAGVAVTSFATGAASLIGLLQFYRDDPFASLRERYACERARAAAWKAVGVTALIAAVCVPLLGRGTGGAVLTSGLKTVGGGSMEAGLGLATMAPVAAAALLAQRAYDRALAVTA